MANMMIWNEERNSFPNFESKATFGSPYLVIDESNLLAHMKIDKLKRSKNPTYKTIQP